MRTGRAAAALVFASLLILVGCDDGAGSAVDPGADARIDPDGSVDATADAVLGVADAMLDATADAMLDGMPAAADDMLMVADAMPGVMSDAMSDAMPDGMPDAMPDAMLDGPLDAAPDAGPPPLFDLPLLRDAVDADCRFDNPRQTLRGLTLLDVWDVSYISYEVVDGQLHPIRMRAFAARPAGADGIPGIVQAHGLGGFAEPAHAEGPAALTGAFVIAYTGPGGGDAPENTSEGLPAGHAEGYRMFDVLDDARGSWFWAHGVAAMRALTCVENHPAVDRDRLGMTGYSAGAVATLMAAGVDDRIRAAVPLSGTGAWDLAVRSPTAWQHGLLDGAGLDTDSPEWTTLLEHLDVAELARGAAGAVLMVNGSSDEFFPLDAHRDTFDGLPGPAHRTSISGNYDHGCYALTGGEPADAIEERAVIRAEGGQRMWFAHHFGTDPAYATLPAAPTARVEPVGPVTIATAVVDVPPTLRVRSVKYWWSNDRGLLFAATDLEDQGGGLWAGPVLPPEPQTVWYVDVEYRTGPASERFSLSTPPHIPDGFVANIRRNDTCLPP